MAKKARFDVVLNEKMVDLFDELTKDGESRSEVFKKAMATYKVIKKQEEQGGKTFLESESGVISRLVLP